MTKQTKMWLGIGAVALAGFLIWKQSKTDSEKKSASGNKTCSRRDMKSGFRLPQEVSYKEGTYRDCADDLLNGFGYCHNGKWYNSKQFGIYYNSPFKFPKVCPEIKKSYENI